MRKTVLNGLIAGAFALAGGLAHAGPLVFSLDGVGNTITATSLDWAQTSFLALGGNAAITNFVTGNGGPTTFDVLTHAKMSGYNDQFGVTHSLPSSFTGEITVVSRFTERVFAADPGAGSATFRTTGAGWIEMYYSASPNSDNLRGSNFNDGTLIMRGDGVSNAFGGFTNTSAPGTSVDLDQAGLTNDYTGQMSVEGFGSQGNIKFGTRAGFAVDTNFLKTQIVDFSLFFNNISIGLPFQTVDPSDCFNPNQSAATNASITAHTATGQATQCNALNHFNGTYAQNVAANGNDGGYVPIVGGVNGAFGGSPDFVAQTDFNSRVTGTVPEPGMLALLGLAFAGLGLSTVLRRRS